ncbi:hypothetical protein HPB48_017624 [Haemaphysalis longicornis]|uniref:Uncharacterized protein n=1 Tax=Haemaphysalis longicornis TaxID=44386 RepID=A0A9J6GNA4_HAELO|nr:hypothetical protein HPB48_017624 [Haemaphysalis longicornis]
MLAHPTKAISEALNRFEGYPFTGKFKHCSSEQQLRRLIRTGRRLHMDLGHLASLKGPVRMDLAQRQL